MRVAVIGAGAVGSLLAGCLSLAGHEVTLVDRFALGDDRVELRDPAGEVRAAPVTRTTTEQALPEPLDVAVLAVKRFDLAAALAGLASRPDAAVLTIQNGVGAEEEALAARPGSRLLAGSLTAALARGPAGDVEWETRGGIGLAAVSGEVTATLAALAEAFSRSGLRAATLADWRAMKWSKLVANLVGNATSALLDLGVDAIVGQAQLYQVEREQHREALAVMRALGLRPVALPGANVPLLARGFALPGPIARPILARVLGGARGSKMPSLRIALHGPGVGRVVETEVEWLNGAVAAEAVRQGIAAPVNDALSRLVQQAAADPERRAWFAHRPDHLLAALVAGA